ncbi:MAG: SusE domain-containing protein [Chitinophagaceae bacterium]|nr:SusE domain-containing protein [Bacteroidota bacterium]MCC6256784.1 SusE domain-containing protein [Chitinophagaceae bacterium]MCW5917044.1 SusE domain-containing protein [Ferruginibacter sp.]
MKNIFRLILAAAAVFFYSACNKVDDLPLYGNGKAPVLSASVTTVAAQPADSLNTVITFNWTDPQYATAASNQKYILEIDSAGRNFSKANATIIMGKLDTSFTAKQLNDILLGFGFNYNVAYPVEVRVTSSYGNNNERLVSNVLSLTVTPYKIPPKITPPAALFIVGSATQGGWTNPVPVPAQQFAQIDETTFMGVFNLNGGSEYLLLPVNGDWGQKYAIEDNSIPGVEVGGDFQFYTSGGSNFKGPVNAGMYLIVVDFQRGKYSVTPYNGPNLPDNLFIVGSATPGAWNNPVPVPSQQFTRLNSVEFELTLAFNGGAEYLLLPENGNWGMKYAVADNSIAGLNEGGYFGFYTSGGSNFPGPTNSGNYKIHVNFALHDPAAPNDPTAKFTVTPE